MSRGWHSFRDVWRHQGPWRAMVRVGRSLLKPMLDVDVLYVFERSLRDSPSEYPLPGGISIAPFKGVENLIQAQSAISSFCPDLKARLCRGDMVIVAFAEHEVAGYTWMSFSDVLVEELGMMAVVRKGEAVHYDSYVCPAWRGRALHTCLIVAAKNYARREGCERTVSWISAANPSSLKTAKRLSKKSLSKPMIVLSVKVAGMERRRNLALRGSLRDRFYYPAPQAAD